MPKIDIHGKIVDSLGLSKNERAVFDVLVGYPMARNVSHISKEAGLPRITTLGVLRRLENRKLVVRVLSGKRYHWRYKRGLEFLRNAGFQEKISGISSVGRF